MNPASIIAFLISNWKFIAGASLVVGLMITYKVQTDHYYEVGKKEGIEAQFKKCSKDMEDLVEKHNNQVALLEDAVKKLGDQLTTSNAESAEKVRKLMAELNRKQALLDRNIYTADGTVIKCLPEGAVVHLGKEFSDEWNQLNKEGQTK